MEEFKVGSKVKFNVDFLEAGGFDELNESEISFIHENRDTIFVIDKDWNNHIPNNTNVYRFELDCGMFASTAFQANELILVECSNV